MLASKEKIILYSAGVECRDLYVNLSGNNYKLDWKLNWKSNQEPHSNNNYDTFQQVSADGFLCRCIVLLKRLY